LQEKGAKKGGARLRKVEEKRETCQKVPERGMRIKKDRRKHCSKNYPNVWERTRRCQVAAKKPIGRISKPTGGTKRVSKITGRQKTTQIKTTKKK